MPISRSDSKQKSDIRQFQQNNARQYHAMVIADFLKKENELTALSCHFSYCIRRKCQQHNQPFNRYHGDPRYNRKIRTYSGSEIKSFSTNLFDEIRFYCFLAIGFVSISCNGINIRVLQNQRIAFPYIYMTFLAISDFITGIVTKFGHIYIFKTVIMYLKFLFQQMLPLLLMSTTNILTIREIVKGIEFRKSSTNNNAKNRVRCLGVTLGVITVLILTNCPAVANTLSILIGATSGPGRVGVLHILELLRWTCCVTNFFIYVILDKRFRDEVVNLFSCWLQPKIKQHQGRPVAFGTEISLNEATGQTTQHSRLAIMEGKPCTCDV
ncbi:hypothetical protein CAPTEDRAFT_187990 [Capitella teleta]|uniref:G-protein coupled receptors family 1 profile domain-containing protein n=1 Tax=Capitella teleta TaxID=283909 RepID=R7U483_CAPTE|nr:hypothetical protein CAPTEDRAFT_187990 [Capitella teleta]|eukprot:ELU01165.1 hypothetical protein CAPTEDRAFT_187990 [Capitella teleta]